VHFHTTKATRVTMLTFGNQLAWTAPFLTDYHPDFIVEQNEAYTVFKFGLNLYVFATRDIRFVNDERVWYPQRA
jgi:hypothetical protein